MPETNYLLDILILLAAAIIAVPIFKRLGIGSILGYLVAGAIVGPWGLGFIDEITEIRHIAEFGVVFLLFIIGIELKPARLWKMRRTVFGLGSAQVLITGLVITGIAFLLGQSLKIAVIIGFGLALSSTAFGLQILTEKRELRTNYGRSSFSILLFQDLAVVPLLALVSLLAIDTDLLEGIEFALLETLLIIVSVILVGRFLLTPALKLIAATRMPEIFTMAAVFAVLGTAWLMEEAGLSLAMGAFLAGLMMADSQYRHQVVADIKPYRGILLGLFFMGVGMSIDFGLLGDNSVIIAGAVIGLLLLKFAIIWVLCRFFGIKNLDALRVGFLLSQSGEFGFVIFGLAALSGILTIELFQLLTLVVALTMVTTPLLARLSVFLSKKLRVEEAEHDVTTDHIEAGKPHVIIAGFGRVGRRIAMILKASNIPYIALDINAERVLDGRQRGCSVFYGDASQLEVLRASGSRNAGLFVCTLDSTASAVRIVSILRERYPDLQVYARGRDSRHCNQLLRAGASLVVSETLEASLQLSESVLEKMGIEDVHCASLVDSFRQKYYGEKELPE